MAMKQLTMLSRTVWIPNCGTVSWSRTEF